MPFHPTNWISNGHRSSNDNIVLLAGNLFSGLGLASGSELIMNTMWATVILFNLLALSVQSQPTIVNRDISTTLYDDLKFFAQYAGAGYCDNNEDSAVDTVISCIDDVCPDVTAAGAYNIVEFIGASTDQEGFVAIDPKNSLIVVSFRGSDSIKNFIYDILFTDTDCEFGDGCKAEYGFYTSWLDVKEVVLGAVATAVASFPDYQLVTTGHSLGGAVAVIAGAYLRDNGHDSVDIYTYGCPRVFNDVGADYVTAQGKGGNHRVTHLDDLVPRLPPILFGYRHISPEYWLSDGTDLTNEYAISEIKICTGIANTSCNAGGFLFDILAHWHYFEALSACWDLGLKRRKGGLPNGNSDEITVVMGRGSANVSATNNALQKTWLAQLDMQFVEALGTVA